MMFFFVFSVFSSEKSYILQNEVKKYKNINVSVTISFMKMS